MVYLVAGDCNGGLLSLARQFDSATAEALYSMPAPVLTTNARKAPKCSLMSTALKPTTGMEQLVRVPIAISGANATYSRPAGRDTSHMAEW